MQIATLFDLFQLFNISNIFFRHYRQNYPIRLLHSLLCQDTYIGNGIFNTFCDNLIPTFKFRLVPVHIISQDSSIHTCCNFGHTGWFCAITNCSTDGCYRIYACMPVIINQDSPHGLPSTNFETPS